MSDRLRRSDFLWIINKIACNLRNFLKQIKMRKRKESPGSLDKKIHRRIMEAALEFNRREREIFKERFYNE